MTTDEETMKHIRSTNAAFGALMALIYGITLALMTILS